MNSGVTVAYHHFQHLHQLHSGLELLGVLLLLSPLAGFLFPFLLRDVVPHNDANNVLGQRIPKLLQNLARCCNLFLLCACEDGWVSPISPSALAFQMVIQCAGRDAKLECCSMYLHLP